MSDDLYGVGVDIVDVRTLDRQLATPGSTFVQVFTDREIVHANRYRGLRIVESLAAAWAAKEAMVKAWSHALFGQAPLIDPDELVWSEIEVVHDRWNRPSFRFHGTVARTLTAWETRCGRRCGWYVALSHDGDYAIAYVVCAAPDMPADIVLPSVSHSHPLADSHP